MIYYKIGDVVEITRLVSLDAQLGIKLGILLKLLQLAITMMVAKWLGATTQNGVIKR